MVYAAIVLMSTMLSLAPYPIAIIMTACIVGKTCVSSTNSLLSALFMQIQNAGLKINFGLSRGTGSVLFVFTSYVGGNTANLGFALFIYAIVEILPMLLSVKLLDKFGPKKLMVVAVFAFLIKVFLVKMASSVGLIYAIAVTNIFSNGIFFASVYFINEIVRPNERTRGQALRGLCSFYDAVLHYLLICRFFVDAGDFFFAQKNFFETGMIKKAENNA